VFLTGIVAIAPAGADAASSPASVALPPGDLVTSMSWPTATTGWAIAGGALESTHDGGQTWTAAAPGSAGTEWATVAFADEANGWVTGQTAAASTHDGGQTWTPIVLPAGAEVGGVAAARGRVHLAVLTDAVRVESSPVTADQFADDGVAVAFGAGPIADVRLTAGGPYAAMVYNDRTFIGGAQIRQGAWEEWTPECPNPAGSTASVSLSPNGRALTMACATAGPSGPPFTVVAADLSNGQSPNYVDLPGGSSNDEFVTLSFTAATDAGARLVGVATGAGLTIDRSTDKGATWATVATLGGATGGGAVAPVPGVGIVVATGPGQAAVSTDDGASWTSLPSAP